MIASNVRDPRAAIVSLTFCFRFAAAVRAALDSANSKETGLQEQLGERQAKLKEKESALSELRLEQVRVGRADAFSCDAGDM
jgi:hypothetical protein